MKKIFVVFLALTAGVSFLLFNVEESKATIDPNECAKNGYKLWNDPGWFGNQNFHDCNCSLRRGQNPVPCES